MKEIFRLSGDEIKIEHIERYFDQPGNEKEDEKGEVYVIFTSGSTGKAKGVKCHQIGLINRLFWMQEEMRMKIGGRVIHKTPCTFDVSMWEIFWPLSFGGHLLLSHPQLHFDMKYVKEMINRGEERIFAIHFVPSLFDIFLDELQVAMSFPNIDFILLSGEPLSLSLMKKFFRIGEGKRLPRIYNLYGPTEASIDVSYYEITHQRFSFLLSLSLPSSPLSPPLSSIPIGFPLFNTCLSLIPHNADNDIRDENDDNPIGNCNVYSPPSCEVKEVGKGEIVIKGRQVSTGYISNDSETQKRFKREGEYQTGDRGRLVYCNGDYWLEYLGRSDHQIKIFGIRIELSEIEIALSSHPDIQSAVVIPHPSHPSLLCAFLLLQHNGREEIRNGVEVIEGGIDKKELKEYLKKRISVQKIPSSFYFLRTFPVTPHGKLDRCSLSLFLSSSPSRANINNNKKRDWDKLEEGNDQSERTWKEGRERRLDRGKKEIKKEWKKMFEKEEIGEEENFFELGGDSILALHLISSVRSLPLSISLLYLNPSISMLISHFSNHLLHCPPSSNPLSLNEGASEESEVKDNGDDVTGYSAFSLISNEDREKVKKRFGEEIEDGYPMSQLQMGMVYHSIDNSFNYQVVTRMEMRGEMKEDLFRKALLQLLYFHPILRSFFDIDHFSQPILLIRSLSSLSSLPLHFVTLSNGDNEERMREWYERKKEHKFSFTCEKEYLFEITIHYQERERRYQYGMVFHDSILDGWSRASFIQQLFSIYLSLLSSSPIHVQEKGNVAKLGYHSFVKEEMKAILSSSHLSFWLHYLPPSPPLFLLPSINFTNENPSTSPLNNFYNININNINTNNNINNINNVEKSTNEDYEIDINEEIKLGIERVCRKERVPLKIAYLGVHFMALRIMSGKEEITTGVVYNARLEQPGGSSVLGNHLNTLPFHLSFSALSSFHNQAKEDLLIGWSELLQEIHKIENQILPHRAYPSSQITKNIRNIQSPPSSPLFHTAFNFTNFHSLRQFAQSLNSSTHSSSPSTLKESVSEGLEFGKVVFTDPFHYPFVAIFRIDEIDEQLKFIINYTPSIYPRSFITQSAQLYCQLLQSLSSSHSTPISLLSHLSLSHDPIVTQTTPSNDYLANRDDNLVYGNITEEERMIFSVVRKCWHKVTNQTSDDDHINNDDGNDTHTIEELGADSFQIMQFCFIMRRKGYQVFPHLLRSIPSLLSLSRYLYLQSFSSSKSHSPSLSTISTSSMSSELTRTREDGGRREKSYKKEVKYEEVIYRRVLLLPVLLFPQSPPSPLSLSSLLSSPSSTLNNTHQPLRYNDQIVVNIDSTNEIMKGKEEGEKIEFDLPFTRRYIKEYTEKQRNHYNAEVAFGIAGEIDIINIIKALHIVINHHLIFRVRLNPITDHFVVHPSTSFPLFLSPLSPSIHSQFIRHLDEECKEDADDNAESDREMNNQLEYPKDVVECVQLLHSTLSTSDGPSFQAALFFSSSDPSLPSSLSVGGAENSRDRKDGDDERCLREEKKERVMVIVGHHLFFDGYSMQILVDDILSVATQLQSSLSSISLLHSIPSPSDHSQGNEGSPDNNYDEDREDALIRIAREYAQYNLLSEEREYWENVREKIRGMPPMNVDFPQGINSDISTQTISFSLSSQISQKLVAYCKMGFPLIGNSSTGSNNIGCFDLGEVILCGVMEGLWRWQGREEWSVEFLSHGRDHMIVDLSRTIAELCLSFPLLLSFSPTLSFLSNLHSLSHSFRHLPPHFTYLLSMQEAEKEEKNDKANDRSMHGEIFFNHIGNLDSGANGVKYLQRDIGCSTSLDDPHSLRFSLLDIQSVVHSSRLHFDISFSSNLFSHSSIQHFASCFRSSLLSFCQSLPVQPPLLNRNC